jgi:flagellar basal-body rod modification protein FlgD
MFRVGGLSASLREGNRMDVTGLGPKAAPPKTEWASDVTARAPEGPPQAEVGVGQQLNQMAGIQTQESIYKDPKKLDKEAFLKMFMEQLKYQDPMNPVDNEKVAQQMAMFSQLEQQVTTNQHLEKMLAKQGDGQAQALGMIGKHIAADRASIFHNKEQLSPIQFQLPQDANELKVEVLNQAGEVIKTMDVGKHTEGKVEIKWDGLLEDGKPADSGRYFYAIKGKGIKGEDIAVSNKIEGKVNGITTSNGQTFLLVGEQKIAMHEVNTIKDPSIAAERPANAGIPAGTNPVGQPVATSEATNKTDESQTGDAAKVAEPSVNIDDEAVAALKGQAGSPTTTAGMMDTLPLFFR